MSVVHFGARELADLILGLCDAKTLARELALSGGDWEGVVSSCLRYELSGAVAYSKVNTDAFAASYRDEAGAQPVTREDLLACIMATILNGGPHRVNFAAKRAESIGRTLRLMAYNAVDQRGKDHLEGNPEAARAIIDFQGAALRYLMKEGEHLHGKGREAREGSFQPPVRLDKKARRTWTPKPVMFDGWMRLRQTM